MNNRIQELRKLNKIRQEDLAEAVGVTRQTMRVTGTAVAGSDTQKDWATEFAWDMQKPRVLLNERFDNVADNKTLLLDGWQNVVLQGDRPWWGFDDKDAAGNVLEHCAKVTAYIYQEKDSVPWEMWLVTPALDYKNAKAKTFTLRVRGDYLSEGQSAELGVYYIDATDPQDVFFQDLGLGLPRTADESGEWVDIHINLEGQEETIADVFFMAFRFTGKSGQTGAATYLLDDVSWGRTDLPRITADSTTIILTTTPNAIEAVAVNVTGHNAGRWLPIFRLGRARGIPAPALARSSGCVHSDGGIGERNDRHHTNNSGRKQEPTATERRTSAHRHAGRCVQPIGRESGIVRFCLSCLTGISQRGSEPAAA